MGKYVFLLIALAVVNTAGVFSQVTIGSNTVPEATLELVGKVDAATVPDGVIAPRLTGDQLAAKNDAYSDEQNSAIVYVTKAATTPSGKTVNITAPGFYYYDAVLKRWMRFTTGEAFFYLPSFNLDVSFPGVSTLDIYNEVYVGQFDKSVNSLFMSSDPSVTKVPGMYKANELIWVVTAYDHEVLTVNSISAEGVMEYDVLNADPDPSSYINIIAIPKR